MRKTLLQFSIIILTGIMLSSCEKTPSKYPFTILVISETGVPINNVYVEAGAPIPKAIPDFKGSTNLEGRVSFEYDYEAVLQIVATRGENPPSYIGCGFVKLEADKNVEVTIVLQPYDPSQQGC